MKDPYLDIKLEHARKEHQKISQAIIEKNEKFIKEKYGSLKNANDKLLELEYFLNFKSYK
ncbi:TPA: hypothetical protein ITS68_002492 [Enterococcus faecalis]|uniref:hypothetical protein n=1 Tax=Enterococcus TaxID=1350 RepID=UPI001144789B|nr:MULTISPECIES: hypothetical protein [Enterococcus]MCL4596026.1 hypothetical protein [Enterococcus faecalis]MDB1685327.1 hypothetical protein [Enterococcus durans]NSW26220.1 hypothetical protein [Enterococcus faecalis]TQB47734.1 hypothetical protein FKZ14_14580 [Enterococcus faecalis]TQB60949.1 hypothetical protein FKZ15_14190 [Enterococcus faecalis]